MCHKLSDWNRHLLTKKHKINEAGGKSHITFTCECGNMYKERTGLWRHKKKCITKNDDTKNDDTKNDDTKNDDTKNDDTKNDKKIEIK